MGASLSEQRAEILDASANIGLPADTLPRSSLILQFDLNGGQGRNRTTDTRIFSPLKPAPRNTQDHLKQPIGRKPPFVRCSWVTVSDAGLETKVETGFRPESARSRSRQVATIVGFRI